MKIERILYPTDFSEASAHALEQAVVIAGSYYARITALHVFSPSRSAMPRPAASSAPKSIAKTEIERLRTQTAAFVAAVFFRPAGLRTATVFFRAVFLRVALLVRAAVLVLLAGIAITFPIVGDNRIHTIGAR